MIRSFVKRRLSRGLRAALRQVADEWRSQRIHRASARRAAELTTAGPVRLNLGCGDKKKPGWVNVDLYAPEADLRLDLREPLPFPDGSIIHIYCEHFFEHLEYPDVDDAMATVLETPERSSEALGFLRECRRVLAPGGVLDILVPDAERKIGMYVKRREDAFPVGRDWWGPAWCDTPMHCINYLFRQGREHKYAYDEETLTRAFETAGFVDVRRRPYDPSLDAPSHELGSLCLVGRKPGAASG